MKTTNKAISDLIIAHKNDETLAINPLSMKINGIVDPAVMGGFKKYEEAFLTSEYLMENIQDENLVEDLKELIASQIPLLEIAISVHHAKAPKNLLPFHENLEKCFNEMQLYVEKKYGKRVIFLKNHNSLLFSMFVSFMFQTSHLKFERDSYVTMRRQGMVSQTSFDTNRLSETSVGSAE